MTGGGAPRSISRLASASRRSCFVKPRFYLKIKKLRTENFPFFARSSFFQRETVRSDTDSVEVAVPHKFVDVV